MKNLLPVTEGSTIYDVAELAQVSITTVSRFLNSPEKVNSDTAKKVQAAMDRLSYIPHGNSGTKARRQVGRIGILAPFITAPSFVQRLQGMMPLLHQAHCEMVIYAVDTPEQLNEYLHSIPFSKRLDGLVIMAMRIGDADAHRLIRAGFEVVLVEQSHPEFCAVEADNVQGGALAAAHLLSKGYEACGFVGEKQVQPFLFHPGAQRWNGYSQALAAAGRPVQPQHVRLGEWTAEDGFRMGLDLLSSPKRPRAVFAVSDLVAIGVLRAARRLNLRVPEDVAVLGFDDIEAAEYMELSTVSQSLSESGRLAAELLLARIREPDRPLQSIQLQVDVVQRSTT